MADRFPVLLVDDGELDDVRDCLLAIGAEFAHLRGGAVPSQLDPPRDLFITSTRHANLARPWPRPVSADRPVRIAVVSEDSGTLRATLRRLGYTFLVRRPVHPVALRLLLLHALYRGEERRAAPRVPLGYPVAVKIGMRRREALLVDLSESGCRILVGEPVPVDTKITIQVPSELCGDDRFVLPGRVVRSVGDRSSPLDGSQAVAVRFGELDDAARALLNEALETHRLGVAPAFEPPTDLPLQPPHVDGDEPRPRLVRRMEPRRDESFAARGEGRRLPQTPAAGAPPARGADRRRHARRAFARRVIAAVPDGSLHRVLIGRDLSPGGMRVDGQPELGVGSVLRIALYDPGREAPIVVAARIARDDGALGMALVFEGLAPDLAARLEQLIATLPPVECLLDGETGALGTVVGEILS